MKTEQEIIAYIEYQNTLLISDVNLTPQDIDIIAGRLNACRYIIGITYNQMQDILNKEVTI